MVQEGVTTNVPVANDGPDHTVPEGDSTWTTTDSASEAP